MSGSTDALGTQQGQVSHAWTESLRGDGSHGALPHAGRALTALSVLNIGAFLRGSCLSYHCPAPNSSALADLPPRPALCQALPWSSASSRACSLRGMMLPAADGGVWSSGEQSPCLLCHEVDGQTGSQEGGGAVALLHLTVCGASGTDAPLLSCSWAVPS